MAFSFLQVIFYTRTIWTFKSTITVCIPAILSQIIVVLSVKTSACTIYAHKNQLNSKVKLKVCSSVVIIFGAGRLGCDVEVKCKFK